MGCGWVYESVRRCAQVCTGVRRRVCLGMSGSAQGFMGMLEYGSGDYSPTFSGL